MNYEYTTRSKIFFGIVIALMGGFFWTFGLIMQGFLALMTIFLIMLAKTKPTPQKEVVDYSDEKFVINMADSYLIKLIKRVLNPKNSIAVLIYRSKVYIK